MDVTIALIQMDCKFGDRKYNLQKAIQAIQCAADQKAQIICLPESFDLGYSNARITEMSKLGETLSGETVDSMKKLAKERSVFIIAPLLLKEIEGGCKNTAVLISDEGEVIGTYEKSHLTEGELGNFSAGTGYPVFETKYGRIGILICNDLCYPEPSRMMGLQKADIVFIPAAWRYFEEWGHWWRLMCCGRALDNLMVIAAVNRVGSIDGVAFSGESMIVGPDGIVRAEAGFSEERLIMETISVEAVRSVKNKYLFMFRDRKPEEYHMICLKKREAETEAQQTGG